MRCHSVTSADPPFLYTTTGTMIRRLTTFRYVNLVPYPSLSDLLILRLESVGRTPFERSSWCRSLATSAEKRKWKRKGLESSSTERGTAVTGAASTARDRLVEGVNWRPLFFLGVLPVLLSGLVVLARDDLREQLEENGIGRLFRDLKQLKATRALEAERTRSNETAAMVEAASTSSQKENSSLASQHPTQ